MELYKTILVIWTEYPTDEVGLEDLGHAATSGDAYCVSDSVPKCVGAQLCSQMAPTYRL